MQRRLLAALAGLALLGLAGPAKAITVDLQLSLVVDSSGSISTDEFSQQINGYADAFRQAAVIDSIVNSDSGIAVNTILFASSASEVIPFTLLQSEQNVSDFANALDGITRTTGRTNIAAGIDLAVDILDDNGFDSSNVIIDVSGDGVQNEPGDPALSRDAALTAGVSRVNGIAIGIDSVFDFYVANVAGGPDSFVLQAESFDEFDSAIANKIQLEVGAPNATPQPVPAPGAIGLVGIGIIALGCLLRRRSNA
ncbi:MAG: DUF1194 domain-containing protein [Pseudomonadota bacterium]